MLRSLGVSDAGGKAFQALVGSSGLGFGASVVAGCMLFELLLTVRVSRFSVLGQVPGWFLACAREAGHDENPTPQFPSQVGEHPGILPWNRYDARAGKWESVRRGPQQSTIGYL